MREYLGKLFILLALVAAADFAGYAQKKTSVVADKEDAIDIAAEKAVASDVRPTISFCVGDGNVRVRGWQRNEIRAYVENGKVNFKVLNRNSENNAAWLMIVGSDPKDVVKGKRDECLAGSDIEIEVPFGANIDIKSREGDLLVESVAKLRVQNLYGDVLLRDIREETDVSSQQGNVIAEDSTGRFVLKSITGNVLANRLKPLNPSDALIASSNASGNVTIQNVTHANIEARSTSGNLNFFGKLVSGGNSNFTTTSGDVTLFLPPDSSFQVNATMGPSAIFKTSFPATTPANNSTPGRPRNISEIFGKGDATVSLTTFSGALRLQKQ